MGKIVAAAATSHSPGITMFVEQADAEQVKRFHGAMHEVGRRFEEARPDVIILITNEHFTNFYLNNVPAICIGTAESYFGPVEPFIQVPQADMPGHRAIGKRLVRAALDSDFDVSFSEELRFDHGTSVPLHFVNPHGRVPVVPIFVNNLFPPMPTPRRLYDFGQFLGRTVAEGHGDTRIALLATGGLSHKVGTTDAGDIDPDFDRRFLAELSAGNSAALKNLTHDELSGIGNGTHEVRNWMCVMGATNDAPVEILSYEVIPQWATGCAVASWTV